MESSEHNWVNISETICPELLIFGEQASWTLLFENILTNPIISQISFSMTSHLGTLLQRPFVFAGFHRIIELKRSKHEFADIINQNKQGFEGKKVSKGQAGRNSLRFNNMCCRLKRIGDRHTRFKLFSYLDFRVCFACYHPESFKIICLTCIWLKFVDTSFHSSQKKLHIPDK